ncbi:hypothetical protein Tco_0625822 [Tanacetum coccineum]|uniref:Uncharacterized protein n=1 Tax=Tanacetum coccineum TaxID=301880 RepID=A0ABQ4WHW0_9ASTR
MSKQSREVQDHDMTVNMEARNPSETKLRGKLLASKYRVKQGSSFQDGEGGNLRGGELGELNVLDDALSAFGDFGCCSGDGVFESSLVRSTNNFLGRIIVIFGFLESLEVEA